MKSFAGLMVLVFVMSSVGLSLRPFSISWRIDYFARVFAFIIQNPFRQTAISVWIELTPVQGFQSADSTERGLVE